MNKEIIATKNGQIPLLTNESKSKKMLLYLHGLDGSAAFSKPLFKTLAEYKIVAIEARGHNAALIKASRLIYKHVQDYLNVLHHYKKQGYTIWIVAESMGASYATYLGYKYPELIAGIFGWSIPNKLVNIMQASKWTQIKIQLMTAISFFTNINYKYHASVNYQFLSSNKALHRLARMADKNKIRQVRETLATWAINKRVWKYLKSPRLMPTPLYYFQPAQDVIVNIPKAEQAFAQGNPHNKEFILLPNARHILMYEAEFNSVIAKIKAVIK